MFVMFAMFAYVCYVCVAAILDTLALHTLVGHMPVTCTWSASGRRPSVSSKTAQVPGRAARVLTGCGHQTARCLTGVILTDERSESDWCHQKTVRCLSGANHCES